MWWFFSRPSKRYLPIPKGPYSVGCLDVMTKFSREGCFVRLHYPSSAEKSQNDASRWVPWSPDECYIMGFSNVVKIWTFIIKLTMWLLGELYIPAEWEVKPNKSEKMPVIVYSHGFGASRFLCSSTATELASWGYLVASVEHRDHSASITYYYDSPENRDKDKRTYVFHQGLFSGNNHYRKRNEQLKMRQSDCSQVMTLLYEINNGTATNILKSKFDLKEFKDCLDLSSACMMGHSFGGATSVYTLAKDDRFKLGVILDCWMFPLKDETDLKIKQPMIFINTQTFHIPSNLQALQKYVVNADGTKHPLYTIRHTTHEHQTDTAIVWGSWLNLFMKKLDKSVALKINNFLALQFLHKHFGFPKDIDDCDSYIKENAENIVEGPIAYTRTAVKKFSVT
ncbi:platelet-activating factor acetylhydrolase [Nilaparvata lugens]|uniref:platelet-activating factor acetylhydrolase n=1 Tax=Nilaparvata lugens TaxID=108931 RepID=UPI00193DA52C|nr:platelet-activating factor acetylhydrolase [Nilaparvata lugens]